MVLFHHDNDEADEVFEALADLANEFRNRNVFKLVLGKINMNHNEPSEDFPVYQYPSVHIIFKT